MLKGINPLISPELLKILDEMGHGDEIVFGDSNFPAAALARRLVRADGIRITQLLSAILPLFPLDYTVDYSAVVMESQLNKEPLVWIQYKSLINSCLEENKLLLTLPKPEFYKRAEKAYCIVATGENESFANLIIRKGIIRADENS